MEVDRDAQQRAQVRQVDQRLDVELLDVVGRLVHQMAAGQAASAL